MYNIIWSAFSQTTSSYWANIAQYKQYIDQIAALSVNNNLALNVLYFTNWAYVDDESGVRMQFTGYPQQVFDRKTHFATLGNVYSECNQTFTVSFNNINGVMSLTTDVSSYESSSVCSSQGGNVCYYIIITCANYI